MENLINYTLQNLLSQRNDLFGDDCNFLYFKNDESFSSSDGLNSSSKFGQIAYIQNNREYFSESLLLKRNSQEAYNEKFKIFAFLNESIFYSKILPFLSRAKASDIYFRSFIVATSVSIKWKQHCLFLKIFKRRGSFAINPEHI